MSANIIISNDSMNNSSRILASKSNENGLSKYLATMVMI